MEPTLPSLDDIIEHISLTLTEKERYFRVNDLKGHNGFDILLILNSSKPEWRVRSRSSSDNIYIPVANKDFKDYIKRYSIDIDHLYSQLRTTSIEEVMHAKMIYEKGLTLHGRETIKIASAENERFLREVTEAISLLIGDKKKKTSHSNKDANSKAHNKSDSKNRTKSKLHLVKRKSGNGQK